MRLFQSSIFRQYTAKQKILNWIVENCSLYRRHHIHATEIVVYMYVYMYTSSSRTDALICTKLGMLIQWDQKEKQKGQNSWVRVSVRAVSVARKLSTIEERRQD
jgi:hypothetical protein